MVPDHCRGETAPTGATSFVGALFSSGFCELQDCSVNWDPLASVLLLSVFEQRSQRGLQLEAASPYLPWLHLIRLQNGNIPLD